MRRKRYTDGQTQALLSDVVELAGDVNASAAVIRRTYSGVLDARLGVALVGPETLKEWRAMPDDGVVKSHQAVCRMLEMTVTLSAEKLRAYRVLNVTVRLDRAGLEVTGTPLQMILLQTFTALVAVGRDRLAVCGCGRRFVKVGKRKLGCSEKCAKRVYMRKFRQGDPSRRRRRTA
jgi:hypothetical protein